LADPITALVLLGVAVTVIVVDECYKAYQRHRLRKAADRELGITPTDRRQMRRMERERRREEREVAREWQRRMRERQRLVERLRRHGWEGIEVDEDDHAWDEIREGLGLPEYSAEPKDGDRSVPEGSTAKKRGLRDLFKKRKDGAEAGRKRRWFRRRGGRAESPPPYSD
jgi:hypothetical protein